MFHSLEKVQKKVVKKKEKNSRYLVGYLLFCKEFTPHGALQNRATGTYQTRNVALVFPTVFVYRSEYIVRCSKMRERGLPFLANLKRDSSKSVTKAGKSIFSPQLQKG